MSYLYILIISPLSDIWFANILSQTVPLYISLGESSAEKKLLILMTPVFLTGESQGRGSLMGCCLWGHTELDTTEVT